MFLNFRSSKPSIRISMQPIMLDPDPETFTRHFPGRWMSIIKPLPVPVPVPTIPYTALPPSSPLFPVSLLKLQAPLTASSCPSWTR